MSAGGTQDANKTKGECKYTPSPWTLSFVSGKEVPYFDYVEVLQQSSHLQMMYTGSSPTAGIVRPSPHVKIISPMT